MSRQIKDWDKLSEDDKAYLLTNGSPAELQKAGLLPKPDFDLSGAPGSLQEYELKGEGMPVFDKDSEVARKSEGSDPDSEADRVFKATPGPVFPEPVNASKQSVQKPAADKK